MARYFVNRKAQPNGDHEVHVAGCNYMPDTDNTVYLGEFSNCSPAVRKSKKIYPESNGCYFCSRSCHTS